MFKRIIYQKARTDKVAKNDFINSVSSVEVEKIYQNK